MKIHIVKNKIEELVHRYEAEVASSKIKKYTEEDVKKGFILPFFEALGWNIIDRSEVSSEEHIKSSGRVDYGFYLNDWPKFYLEAKQIKINIHDEQWARQAIRYSWNKGITWAVLTNFERLLVFNAQDIKSSLANKLLFDIPYTEYIDEIDRLLLLSKESFTKNALDTYAEKIGKKFQKVPISSLLYKDLDECREILTQALHSWNPKVKGELLDEGVQRFLDRLIFIRVAEDRGVEPPTLLPLLREWGTSKTKNDVPVYASMVGKFRELDKIYNSNLFSEHPFERWEEYSGATEKAIKILYGKEGYYEYDFRVMPADVLGTVYENYLGHRLLQTRSRKKLFNQEEVEISKDAKKRKEQGIYYTPAFIVDYIVKQTLQPVLDRCKTAEQLLKVKVLDPACGSGSFLIKALEVLNDKYKSLGYEGDERTKLLIITHNIYGVDLDEQAVEIARLNLLINSLDGKMKMPYLTDNIKCGNSLLHGTDTELKKFFGANFHEAKPFNWQEEFPNVFEQGGFDVVIGNPPYLDSEEMVKNQPAFRDYYVSKYESAKGNWDIFCIFLEQGINVLRKNGRMGMIVPNKLISAKYADATRNLLSKNNILAISDYSEIAVFQASVYPVVIIVEKNVAQGDFEVIINKGESFPTSSSSRVFSKKTLAEYTNGWAPILQHDSSSNFLDKIVKRLPSLESLDSVNISGAATVSEAYEIKKIIKEADINGNEVKFINTGTIDRYRSLWGIEKTRYIKTAYEKPVVPNPDLKKLYPKRYREATEPKIIIAGMSKTLECFFDEEGEYLAGKSTAIITGSNTQVLKILTAILNSKLLSVIYAHAFRSLSLAGGFYRVGAPQIKLLPFALPEDISIKSEITHLVDKIARLNLKLNIAEKNSNEWERIEADIVNIDKKIDEEIYKLYGLTQEEIKTVESIYID